MTYQKATIISCICKETPNLVHPLELAILSHWAPQKQ